MLSSSKTSLGEMVHFVCLLMLWLCASVPTVLGQFGPWTIRTRSIRRTMDDSDPVNSDLILFSFGQFGPRKVGSELTKSKMDFTCRSELTKGQMDLMSELTNA